MAKKKKKSVKKAAKKKSTAKKRTTKKKATTKKAGQSAKFAATQPPLGGMEDVDERVPALDENCQKILAERDKRRSLKESIDDTLETVCDLLEEHGLECYIVAGNKFFIEPGHKHVKVAKVQQKG